MQIRSQSLLWSKPLHLPHQLHGLQGPGGPDCCPHCPLLLPNSIICSILATMTIQLSQNEYFSHHDLCTWWSFCLECFSPRSLISWKFLLNSHLSLPFSKIIPWPLTPTTIYCLSLLSFSTGCFLLPNFLLQVYSCLYFSSPSRKCKLHESMDLVGQALCWPRRIPGPRITFQPQRNA